MDKYKKIRQIVAWITVICIIAIILITLYCAITGNRYFFGFLYLMLVVPVILWIFMWIYKVISKKE